MKIQFIQDLIDKFRNKIFLLDLFVILKHKIETADKYHTLILGSSHIFPFKPAEGEFNAAMISQDLYSSYMMYKKLNNSDIKNVVVSFSVFSPGYCMIKTAKNWQLSVLYKLLFGIDYEYRDVALEKGAFAKEKHFQKAINSALKKVDKLLKKERKIKPETLTDKHAERVAAGHLKNNQREVDEMLWCQKIIELAEQSGQNLFFFIAPFTRGFKKYLPSSDVLFEKLYNMCKGRKNVYILNYYDYNGFEEKDFMGCDHLGIEAWQEIKNKESMTDILRQDIKAVLEDKKLKIVAECNLK